MLTRSGIFSLILVFFGALNGHTQTSANPFEVRERLAIVLPDSVGNLAGLSNPFDVVPHQIPGATKALSEEVDFSKQVSERLIAFPKGNTVPKSFIFGILLLLLTFFTLAVAANRTILLKAWRSFLSSNAMNQAQREALGFSGNTPYLLMYINFLLNAGVFTFLIVQSLNTDGRFNNFAVFFICVVVGIVILLLKHTLITVMTWLFTGISTDLYRYNFLIIVFSCVLGFFLIPFNFLIAFAGTQNWQFFVTLWLLALSAIFVIYGLIRALTLGTKYLFGYPMHFLLYLCVAEIVPVLLIIKLLR